MDDEQLTDELKADVMVKVLEDPSGWQLMMSSLVEATRKATEETFVPMLRTVVKIYGEDSPQSEMARAARERSLKTVSGPIARPFALVAGHPGLSEDGATRFHVFLTVLSRDMVLKRDAEEAVVEATGKLIARFPEATTMERTISLEVMDS